jgi:hypothetical protein
MRLRASDFCRDGQIRALAVLALSLLWGTAWAQTHYGFYQPPAPAPAAGQSSTTSTDQRDLSGATTPTRVIETHTEAKGRKVDTQVLQRPSVDGRLEPWVEHEEETVQVDPQTVRVVRRLFNRDPDGRRKLIEVTEEEKRTLPGRGESVVRTTSTPDLAGRFRVARRETQERTPMGADAQQTRTTVFLPNINGGLAPSVQVDQIERKSKNDTTEIRSTTLLRDDNGRWEPSEIKESVIQKEGKEARTEEQRVYRADLNRQLSLAERTVSREWKDPNGQEQSVVETYSVNIGGGARYEDERVHLERRLRIVRSTRPDGSQEVSQQLEQRNTVAPNDGLRVTEKSVEVSRPNGRGGTQTQRTVKALDGNGQLREIIVFDKSKQ